MNFELKFPSWWSNIQEFSGMFCVDQPLLWQSSPDCLFLRNTPGAVKPGIVDGIS